MHGILDSIYAGSDRKFINELLSAATWASVHSRVKLEKPSLFNALNHTTLEILRPGALEAPLLCASFRTTADYLAAWSAWYGKLDEGRLPRAETEKIATKVHHWYE